MPGNQCGLAYEGGNGLASEWEVEDFFPRLARRDGKGLLLRTKREMPRIGALGAVQPKPVEALKIRSLLTERPPEPEADSPDEPEEFDAAGSFTSCKPLLKSRARLYGVTCCRG